MDKTSNCHLIKAKNICKTICKKYNNTIGNNNISFKRGQCNFKSHMIEHVLNKSE